MGWRAFVFRAGYELRKRSGLLQKDFPVQVPNQQWISLADWKLLPGKFFFESRESLRQAGNSIFLNDQTRESLAVENELIAGGQIRFFNGGFRNLGKDYDWLTNPDTGYRYSPKQHWTQISELDPHIGDIKFVWEKSRFSYLYPVIRHDFHSHADHSAFVLHEIEDWIDKNPLNCGPNYVCSQEISLRLLNWTFALHYYKHAPLLTEPLFQKIIRSMYWQARHVAANINFSRIAVRNNHAITECLGLYLVGMLYPFFKQSQEWCENGKRWLTEEGLYQIYEDGSYLQFSMNYHRVAMQLFTWAFVLAERNGDQFEQKLYGRVQKSLDFLHQHQDSTTGHLPNYGANDGALFFRLNSCQYRDFRPQLSALHCFFHRKPLYGAQLPENAPWHEDVFWYGIDVKPEPEIQNPEFRIPYSFPSGGFYILRDTEKFAFIRCGNHPDRPSQADNQHLDLWAGGLNLMRDAGSYKYNADAATLRYFTGTGSHNTLQISDFDQMQKGGRFIWYQWSQAVGAQVNEDENSIFFEGKTHVFKHVHKQIFHTRQVRQFKNEQRWEINDRLDLPSAITAKTLPVYQRWHPHPEFLAQGWRISCTDLAGQPLPLQTRNGWHSSFYGVKEPCEEWFFENQRGEFQTVVWKDRF